MVLVDSFGGGVLQLWEKVAPGSSGTREVLQPPNKGSSFHRSHIQGQDCNSQRVFHVLILERKKKVYCLKKKTGLENSWSKNVHVCVCFADVFSRVFTRPKVTVLFFSDIFGHILCTNQNMDSRTFLLEFQSWLCHWIAVLPSARSLASLCCCLLCEMWITIEPTSEGCCKN